MRRKMTAEERREKRQAIFNGMLIIMQLTGLHSTYPLFEMEFSQQMQEKTGEYTDEDKQWMHENLNNFVKYNSKANQ